MAKSKDATPAETGGDSQSQTPEGGKQQRQTQESTTQGIDFETGQPVGATGEQEGQPQQTSSEDATPADHPEPGRGKTGDTVTMPKEAFNQRLERERQKVQEQYKDYDELKKAAEKLEEIEGQTEEEEKLLAEKLADAQTRHRELEIELQEARIRNTIVGEASKMGFVDPSDAYQLLSVGELEFDDAGNPTNITAQLEALKEAKPYLFSRRAVPQVDPANASRESTEGSRTDADRRRDYFGQGGRTIWDGGGLRVVERE